MSSDCGICGKPLNNDDSEQKIKCSGICNNYFHSRCIQEDVRGTKTRSFRDWKCEVCRSVVYASPKSEMKCASELTKLLEDFKKQMLGEMKSTRSEINGLANSMQFFSDKMDESTNLMKEIREELAAVKKENESLRVKNAALNSEVSSLKDRVRSLEQYSRKNNVEISGIPETPKEDVCRIVRDVGATLGVEVLENDISTAHRVPTFKKDRPPPIIVQFCRRTIRDALISKFRDRKKMTANQIHAALPSSDVYVNEHLSPENKLFLSKLKQKCKEIGFNYAWCRDGKFFVRRSQGERCLKVDTYEELAKLK